jgi:hypothetical protein
MAAPARGLTPADLTAIREALAAGRRPKVVFTSSAGQMAGNPGHVVELTDPSASDEWIVVQFGRDELPFSPTDLAVPVRAAAARKADPRPETRARARTEPRMDSPEAPVPTPRKEAAVTTTATVTTTSNGATSNGATSNRTTSNGATTAEPVASSNGGPDGGLLKGHQQPRAAKPAKPKAPASLVVTLTYADKEWMVAANQGSKALAKPYVIKPTEALRMVALIDVPGVHDAVESIIAAERAEAEQRALRLREELAEIESRLAELSR